MLVKRLSIQFLNNSFGFYCTLLFMLCLVRLLKDCFVNVHCEVDTAFQTVKQTSPADVASDSIIMQKSVS